MIKTLRITSILAGTLAIACLAMSVQGIEDDPVVGELLEAPGAVAQFEKIKGKNLGKAGGDTKSPLVAAAEELAKLINPKPKIVRKAPRPTGKTSRPRGPKVAPSQVSTKFKLVGTCYSDIPAHRFAIIDEPGQGRHWVRESDKIGHMTIQEIKDSVVVVHNGAALEELLVEKTEVVNLMDDGTATSAAPAASTPRVSGIATSVAAAAKPPVKRPGQTEAAYQATLRAYRARQAAAKTATQAASSPAKAKSGRVVPGPPKVTRRPISTDQDKEQIKSIVSTLRHLEHDPTASGKTPAQLAADKRAREKLIKDLEERMRRGNLRGTQTTPSLGDRNEQLGGLRSDAKND